MSSMLGEEKQFRTDVDMKPWKIGNRHEVFCLSHTPAPFWTTETRLGIRRQDGGEKTSTACEVIFAPTRRVLWVHCQIFSSPLDQLAPTLLE